MPLVIFFGVATFVVGLMIGSFLNVCIYRMPREESIIYPPSHCPKCYQPIRPEDNIPVVSWFLLRGRCRACGLGISIVYPVVELLTAAVFVLYYWRFVLSYMTPIPEVMTNGQILYYAAFYMSHMAFIAGLFVATVVDFKHLIIPDEISIPGTIVGLAASFAFPQMHPELTLASHPHIGGLLAGAIGAATGAGVIYGIGAAGKAVLGKEAMGFGDVKLMAMIGAFLGWQLTLFVIVLSAALGTVYGLVHVALTGNSKIPYGPFLSAAALVSLALRPQITGFLANVIDSYRFLLS